MLTVVWREKQPRVLLEAELLCYDQVRTIKRQEAYLVGFGVYFTDFNARVRWNSDNILHWIAFEGCHRVQVALNRFVVPWLPQDHRC